MEIKIQAVNFQEALDKAFRDYGIVSSDILDFEESEGEVTLKVNKTIDSEVKLNAEVKSLVESNRFSSSDIAFVCSDNKIHTPSSSTLFDKIKFLMKGGLVPLIGFTNFIEASNEWSEWKGLVESAPIVYNDLILTKEGNLLKGTKFKSVRKANSRLSDPIFDFEVDCSNPDKLKQIIENVLEKVGLGEYSDFRVEGTKCIFSPTAMVPMEVLNLFLLAVNDIPGIKRITIGDGTYKLRGDMR